MKTSAQSTQQLGTQPLDPALQSEQIAHDLGTLLDDAMSRWLTLDELARHQQDAMRLADHALLDSLLARQASMTPMLREIEHRRREIVARATRVLPALRQTSQPRLSQVALALGTAHAPLVERARQLKTIAERTHATLTHLRMSSESLAMHADSVVRSVSHALSAHGTYTRSGGVTGAPPALAIDLAH